MDAVTETYMDVEKYIYKLVHQFQQRHGGEFDELVGQAHILFMRAYNSYDPKKGKGFPGWLRLHVQGGLMDKYRTEAYRRRKLGRVDADLKTLPDPSLASLVMRDRLSQDAREVIRLVSSSPRELRDLLRLADEDNKSDGLWDYLRGLGWTAVRIQESFDEIVDLLGDR